MAKAFISYVLVSLFSVVVFATTLTEVWPIQATYDWPEFPLSTQKQVLKSIRSSFGTPDTYYVRKTDPAFTFLNPAVLPLIYSFNIRGSQANCWWTSLFAAGAVSLPERGVDEHEYQAILASKFRRLAANEPWQTGDVLRLFRARGNVDQHSATYLGKWGGYRLVVTKNGSQDGPYLIMSYEQLVRYVYYNARLAGVYRIK